MPAAGVARGQSILRRAGSRPPTPPAFRQVDPGLSGFCDPCGGHSPPRWALFRPRASSNQPHRPPREGSERGLSSLSGESSRPDNLFLSNFCYLACSSFPTRAAGGYWRRTPAECTAAHSWGAAGTCGSWGMSSARWWRYATGAHPRGAIGRSLWLLVGRDAPAARADVLERGEPLPFEGSLAAGTVEALDAAGSGLARRVRLELPDCQGMHLCPHHEGLAAEPGPVVQPQHQPRRSLPADPREPGARAAASSM